MTRTSRVDTRRAEIIAATVRVLARDGIAGTTTRQIAAEAEVNQATLRYYFGSKDDLLFAVLQEMMNTTREVVQQGIAIGENLHEMIAESIKAFWAWDCSSYCGRSYSDPCARSMSPRQAQRAASGRTRWPALRAVPVPCARHPPSLRRRCESESDASALARWAVSLSMSLNP